MLCHAIHLNLGHVQHVVEVWLPKKPHGPVTPRKIHRVVRILHALQRRHVRLEVKNAKVYYVQKGEVSLDRCVERYPIFFEHNKARNQVVAQAVLAEAHAQRPVRSGLSFYRAAHAAAFQVLEGRNLSVNMQSICFLLLGAVLGWYLVRDERQSGLKKQQRKKSDRVRIMQTKAYVIGGDFSLKLGRDMG